MSHKDTRPYRGKRRKLLETLFDPDNIGEPIAEICRKAGISTPLFYKYTQEPEFNQALIDGTLRLYAKHLPQTANSIIKQAKKGSIQAGKLLHEVLQLAGKGNSQTVNVGVQSGETTTATYANDTEALEDIEASIKELQGYAQEIKARLNNNNRLRDGIHPEAGGKDREEA